MTSVKNVLPLAPLCSSDQKKTFEEKQPQTGSRGNRTEIKIINSYIFGSY